MSDDGKKDKYFPVVTPMTPEQEELLKELREITPNVRSTHSDAMLWRFLRARDYDVKAARDQLEATITWKDALPVVEWSKAWSEWGQFGTLEMPPFRDKGGRPILIVRAKNHNPNWPNTPEAFKCWRYWMNRHMERRMGPSGTNSEIFDFKGVGRRNVDLGVLRESISEGQQYHPERLGVIFVVNYPWWMWALYKSISGFLDAKVKSKIHFLGSNYKDAFLEVFDADQLYEEYGGNVPNPVFSDQFDKQTVKNAKEGIYEHTDDPEPVFTDYVVKYVDGQEPSDDEGETTNDGETETTNADESDTENDTASEMSTSSETKAKRSSKKAKKKKKKKKSKSKRKTETEATETDP